MLARHPEVFLGLDIADTVRAAAGSIARRLEVGEVDPRCASPGHSKSDLECDHPTTQKAPFYADFEFRGTLSARMSPVSASCARLGKQNRFGVPVFIAPSVTLSPRLMTSTATSPLDRCRAHLPRAEWVSTFLLEWLRKQCSHPAQGRRKSPVLELAPIGLPLASRPTKSSTRTRCHCEGAGIDRQHQLRHHQQMPWHGHVTRSVELCKNCLTSPSRKKRKQYTPCSGLCPTTYPRAAWVSMFLLESLKKQCNHPAQGRTSCRTSPRRSWASAPRA